MRSVHFDCFQFSALGTDSTCWGLGPKNEKQSFQIQITRTRAIYGERISYMIHSIHALLYLLSYMNSIIRTSISWEWCYVTTYHKCDTDITRVQKLSRVTFVFCQVYWSTKTVTSPHLPRKLRAKVILDG